MKKIIFSTTLLIGVLTSMTGTNNGDNLVIDIVKSNVKWIGKKVTGEHSGTVKIKEGTLHVHDGQVENGQVIIDMTTILCEDLEGKSKQNLEKHLKNSDFFDVKNHNLTQLDIVLVTLKEGKQYEVLGNLTIKGITKPIKFPATIEIRDGKLGAYAKLKVDRTLYGIKYKSDKFFEDLGDKVIDDEFIIEFKISAKN